MAKKNKEKPRLVILDVHAIIHRAYHALPDFTSPGGEPTGALYGLSSMLLRLIGDLSPAYIVACADTPEPTYRHEAYEEYKAKRPKAEEVLVVQIKKSRDIFEAFGIPLYEKSGFEADDLIGTIVEKMKKRDDIDIVIASGDMDALQLVEGDRVQVYTLKKGITDTVMYNEKAVRERFSFGPELLPDYKGLRGDPSDNIVGVPGIGEKTATELISSFGTIESLYETLKKKPKKFEEKGIKPRIVEILREHEEEARFSKMLATIKRDVPIPFSLPERPWRETGDVTRLQHLFAELGFRSLLPRLRDFFGTKDMFAETPAPPESVDPEEIKKIAIALWLINSDITTPTIEDILHFARTSSFAAAREHILADIKKYELERVYREIELPLVSVIEKMQRKGVKIDVAYLQNLSGEYHKELEERERRIFKAAGFTFNINSPKQLGEALFGKLGLKAKNQKKTAGGQLSTRESELEKLRDAHPIIGEILAHREFQKLLSTYIDNIPGMVDTEGRLHTTFLQAGTTTGRMASQNPNLQNIPLHTELGRKIRNAFIAERGFSIVSFDYSQIELRVAAFLSGDKKLLRIFKEGGDIHAAVAAEVFGVAPEKVDKEMRRRAKVINFGILYGMGINALKTQLQSSREEAQKFYAEYFRSFQGLAEYIERTRKDAAKKGYTTTHFGRRRNFDGLRSPIPYIKAAAERMAVNAPMQGTQSDIIKIAMRRIADYLEEQELTADAFMLLQVHDELVFEIRRERVEEVASRVKDIMENVLPPKETGGLIFKAESYAGKSWGEMKKLKL